MAYKPKHMRPKRRWDEPERCKCGRMPEVITVADGYDTLYLVVCQECGRKTWPKITPIGAVFSWNRGEIVWTRKRG